MSVRLGVVTIALSVVTGVAIDAPKPVTQARARSVSGRVIDGGTGKPVDGAKIIAIGAGIGSTSGANGVFTLASVPADVPRVEFRHPCYFAVQVTVPVNTDVEIEIGLPFDNTSLQRPGCGGLGARKKD